MADIISIDVAGLREVEQAMEELTKASAKSQGRKALMAGGEVFAKQARALVPVDTGQMRETIDVGTQLTRRQRAEHKKSADVEVFAGVNDPGAIAVEFGADGKAPRPFMRPAWDETQSQVLKAISDTLMVSVSKAVDRARAKAARIK